MKSQSTTGLKQGDRVRISKHNLKHLIGTEGTVTNFSYVHGVLKQILLRIGPGHFLWTMPGELEKVDSMGYNCVFIEDFSPGHKCGKTAKNLCSIQNWKDEEREFAVCPDHLEKLMRKAKRVQAKVVRIKQIR